MPAKYATVVESDASMVERKLTGVYCQALVDIPFNYFEDYVDQARDTLLANDINIPLHVLMENPLVQQSFAETLSKLAEDLELQDLEYASPPTATIFQKELAEAQRIEQERQQEEKRKAAEEKAAQEALANQAKVHIKVTKENADRARALLNIAGLI